MIGENRKEEGVHKGLGDNEGGVQLEIEERTFEPKWKSDAGDYLRGVRGCGSSRTNKREKRRKKVFFFFLQDSNFLPCSLPSTRPPSIMNFSNSFLTALRLFDDFFSCASELETGQHSFNLSVLQFR